MSDSFESILDESISALQAGVPLEEVLAEAPDYAAQLRPLLYAAVVLADPQPQLVPEERKSALRTEYLKQVATLPALPAPTPGQKVQAVLHIIQRRLTPKAILSDLATILITGALTLLMAALVLSYVAAGALPGDFLYSYKRSVEQMQLALPTSASGQAELIDQFNQRRLAEIDQLIRLNRAAAVEFEGVVETKGENLWVIAGYTVLVPADATLEGNPIEGDDVFVTGFLRTNQVMVADTVQKIR
jgi:hypothetical protein